MCCKSLIVGLPKDSEGSDQYPIGRDNIPPDKLRPDVVASALLGVAPEHELELEATT